MKTAKARGGVRSGGTVLLDRDYAGGGNERQTYDLAIPGGLSGSAGLVLCIHGGGWVTDDKSYYLPYLKQMSAERGIAAAAVNYRYVSETTGFAEILDDIASALAAIRAEGERRGVVFDRALLTGGSAGGHLSLLYAYSRRDASPIPPVCVTEICGPTDLEDPFFVAPENAMVRSMGKEQVRRLLARGVGLPELPEDPAAASAALRRFSPLTYADRAVPTVFGHGERDEIVPYRNSIALDAKLAACGVEHDFVSFPDSGHGCEDKASMKKLMELFFRSAERYL